MLDKKLSRTIQPVKRRTSHRKSLISIGVALVILVIAGLVFQNRQWIVDEINYLTFKPDSMIASFADQSSMNGEGKFLFYSAHPQLEERAAFNASCPSYSSSIAILGCYDGQRIYIYNITNQELTGIRAETAAYEMLHAAYKRITGGDKTRLDTLIEAEYKKQATTDTDASVQYFAKYEPGERDDELFSVIATQFKTISPDLESYYSRYFNDRQTLVALYDSYSSVFTGLENQATALYNQINAGSKQIQTDKATYDANSTQLQADISAFNDKSSSGGFTTQSQYDSARAALEARISALEAERTTINNEVDDYNNKVTQYQALSVQVQQLNDSIDSSLSPTPSI